MSAVKNTVSHAGIYALGNIIRYMASFLMLPVYTRYLSPADYGILELLSMVTDLAGIVFGMRIGEAILRNYAERETTQQKNSVITTSMALHALTFGVGVVGLLAAAQPISVLVFGSSEFTDYVRMFAVILLLQALSEVPLVFIRARQKPWLFVRLSVLKLLLQLGFNIYFVVFQGLRIEGVIYGTLLSSGIYTVLLVVLTIRVTGLVRPDVSLGQRMFGFSLPLMLADIGSFYLTFGDRYFLRVFSDFSEIGIYALAYKFGFLLVYLVGVPFSNVWDTQKYHIQKKPDARQIFQRTFLMFSFVIIFVGLGISLFVGDVLKLMSAPEFWAASRIVPVIIVAYIVHMWFFYCSFGIFLSGNTSQITYAAIAASLAITAAYFLLIPPFGGMGAALATLFAFLVRLVWVDVTARKHYDMNLPWGKVISILGVAVSVFFVGNAWSPEQWILSLLWKGALCLMYLGLFLIVPIFTDRQKKALWALVRNPARAGEMIG